MRVFPVALAVAALVSSAASLGHPGRGAANFVLWGAGYAMLGAGLADVDEKGRPNGALMAVGSAAIVSSYILAFIDGATLEPSEGFTYVRPLPKNWRPQDPPPPRPGAEVPQPTPAPEVATEPDAVAAPRLPVETAHVPDPSGTVYIRTVHAGLQQVSIGTKVRATKTDETTIVGTILEVSEVAIVLRTETEERVLIRATELKQVYRAR